MSEVTSRRVERPAPAQDLHAGQERRRAARALLRKPLLHDGSAGREEELRLVRRHRDELTRVFADGLGYGSSLSPALRGCSRPAWAGTRPARCCAGPPSPSPRGPTRCCA